MTDKNKNVSQADDSQDYMEINKGVVITVVVTFQAMFFIYTAGDELSLDIMPSLLLALAIGLGVIAVILVLSKLLSITGTTKNDQ